jgi:hypothetical protein
MTELLEGVVEVRVAGDGAPVALRIGSRWRVVEEVANTWRVETDWWRMAVRRDYVRCVMSDGECVDVYHDLDSGAWHWVRRYD